MDAHTYTLTQTSIIRRHRAKEKTIENQTHKVAAVFVQESVSEPNGFETHKVAAAVLQEPVSEPNGFETQKVAAAFVQEPVSEPNGFGMERGCMYGRTHLHTHTLTNQHHKKAPCKGKTIEKPDP